RCGSALSDEEAEHHEVEGMLYYIKYPVKGRKKLDKEYEDYVVVATTRPETMLGDVAVAVNPNDPRYAGVKEETLVLPIVGRELKVVCDEDVDPEFGTGALKVTPAHDPVDFELGRKHDLESINVMNPDGTINILGGDFEGMDRFECREAIVEVLTEKKLLSKTEKHQHAVGHCYRCHTVVEPRLSKQWFVKMKPLAAEGIKVVDEGKIKFYPARWTKVYLNWMENIRDWCISRQIWWGHRIPVWYCKDCLEHKDVRDVEVTGPDTPGVIIGETAPEKCPFCGGTDLEQDPDVLDTWFSSWLWPFSTMGWPEKTRELEVFYPTDALVTAQEIIFFWVARMIMAGLKFAGDIPFRDVYIHGTVRDSTGTKMSKSLGNVIDPLEIIDQVGSDALRFSIISITAQGQDVFLSKEKFELGRNFTNKLWNASRYVLMGLDENIPFREIKPGGVQTLEDRWILSRFYETAQKVTQALEAYRFNDAASCLYDFVWHQYCDWYLEISKFSTDKETTQQVLLTVLMGCLKLLHPFMPFITEEIWQKLPEKQEKWVMISEWPSYKTEFVDEEAVRRMEKLIGVITAIRNTRAFWNIDHKTEISVLFSVGEKEDAGLLDEAELHIRKLARCKVEKAGKDLPRPEQSVVALVGQISVFVPLGDTIDVEKEKMRVSEKIGKLQGILSGIDKKLGNKSFVEKAPEEVVLKEKEKKKDFEREISNFQENLDALK
ncbi:MAG: valine--tRNA ligase, partial [Candidatus Omnitrophota bacterium]